MLTDFDGVVRHWPASDAASIEDRHGLRRGSLARTAFSPFILDGAITGLLTDAEWRSEVARRLATETDVDTARSAVAAWSTSRGVVDQTALRVLQAARSVAALGLATNATTRLDDDLARLGLSDAFDFVVNSSAVGCAKPSRCFYEHAARRCGYEPGAVLFVDDRPENVDAAIDFGFRGHLHRDPRTLKRQLHAWRLIGDLRAAGDPEEAPSPLDDLPDPVDLAPGAETPPMTRTRQTRRVSES